MDDCQKGRQRVYRAATRQATLYPLIAKLPAQHTPVVLILFLMFNLKSSPSYHSSDPLVVDHNFREEHGYKSKSDYGKAKGIGCEQNGGGNR